MAAAAATRADAIAMFRAAVHAAQPRHGILRACSAAVDGVSVGDRFYPFARPAVGSDDAADVVVVGAGRCNVNGMIE